MPATNKIILGTVQFGLNYGINNTKGKPNGEEIKKIFDLAYENGINMLDTAEAYGDSQETIGEYHMQSKNRFEVITKYSSARVDLPENIANRVEHDLKLLNVSSLFAYMFHSFKDLTTHFEKFKPELLKLKLEGKIKKIGVSIYTNEEAEQVLNYKEIDLVQLPFNLLDNNSQRELAIRKLKDRGIEIHTRSVFLQGLFFMNQESIPAKLLALKPYLQKIKQNTLQYKCSLNDLALNYVLYQKQIDKVLIGVDTAEQLLTNIASSKKELNESMNEIDSIQVKETELLNPANWNA